MDILLVGGGGREHSLAWKIAQSPQLTRLFCAPGNPGIGEIAATVEIADTDVEGLVKFATSNRVDLVVVGPEAPLAAGLADRLAEANIPCFGPSQAAAQLEASKGFVKDLCRDYNIPTAAYGRFTAPDEAVAFLDKMKAPFVIKADGLAAGKGVIIAETREEAEATIHDMLGGQFGGAGAEIVIEEFMEGEEASFFALTDGYSILPFIAAQDHKRAFDGDQGPNTGGMGAYSPAPVFTRAIEDRVMAEIIQPTVKAMQDKGAPYVGVLFAGLMITDDGPKLIEYNARFGDPECQVLMRRMKGDILPLLLAAATGDLKGTSVDWHDDACALIVLAAQGYPGKYEKGSRIKRVRDAAAMPGVEVFHAGTKLTDDGLVANGGRVLNITAMGPTGKDAIAKAYRAVDTIDWPEGFCRQDIGWRLLAREEV